ncbi:MAG: hypothetical protein DDT36_01626 [Firmicutes bacterium]|nr:hypothetical protein [Bacillota bacterium]
MLTLVVGVVGNCVSGKTTLVQALKLHGYHAVNIPQEHSVSQRFFRRLAPDYLIYLSCNLATAKKRRQISWGQEKLDEQWQVLALAKEHANLVIATDDLSSGEVLATALTALESSVVIHRVK